MQHDLPTERVPVDSLMTYPGNPREGDIGAIAVSLQQNGQFRPIVVNRRDMTILAGNHTWKAAKYLGWSDIAVTFIDVDEQQARKIVLADNRHNDLASYNNDVLASLLQQIVSAEGVEGLLGTGFDGEDLDDLLEEIGLPPELLNDPDDVPDNPASLTVNGDVWLLGDHRLVCGDGTDPDTVNKATNGAPIDLVVTDPPYGVSYVGGTGLTIMNDDLDSDALYSLLLASFGAFAERLKPGGPFYIFSPSGQLETVFRLALDKAGLSLRQQLVWVKSSLVLSRSDYHGKHETILYGWSGGSLPELPLPSWEEGIKSLEESGALYEPDHQTVLYGWKEGEKHQWEGGRKQTTVWEFDKPSRSKEHPTMKPVQMIEKAIRNSSQPRDLVFDPFGGSGSTLIAAHTTRRVCGTIELDPKYCDVICARFEKVTGVIPVLESTGEPKSFLQNES